MRISLTGVWPSIFESHPYPWSGYTDDSEGELCLTDATGNAFTLVGAGRYWLYDVYFYATMQKVIPGRPPTMTYGSLEAPSIIRCHRLPWFTDVEYVVGTGSMYDFLYDFDGDVILCVDTTRRTESAEMLVALHEMSQLAGRRMSRRRGS